MGALTFTQLHKGNPCLLPQPAWPLTPKGKGQRKGTVESGRAGAHQHSPQRHSQADSICEQHQGEMKISHTKSKCGTSQLIPTHGKPKRGSGRRLEQRLSLSSVEAGGTTEAVRHPPFQWSPMVTLQLHSLGLPLHGPASQHTSCPGRALHRTRKGHLVLTTAEKRAQETEGTPSYTWREVMHPSEQDVVNQEEPVSDTGSKKTNSASFIDPVHPTVQDKHSQILQAG